MATPDAIARSKHSQLFPKWKEIHETYFRQHSHLHLNDFLQNLLKNHSDKSVLIQITTHAPLLLYKDRHLLHKYLHLKKDQITLLTLQQFDTDIDFCNRIRYVGCYCMHDSKF